MLCFSCKEKIVPEKKTENQLVASFDKGMYKSEWQPVEVEVAPTVISISLSTIPEGKLFFHKDCFDSLAGEEFTDAIAQGVASGKCLLCLTNQRVRSSNTGRTNGVWTCDDCAKLAPKCEPCNVTMVLRFSRRNRNIFFSCSKFPACKNSKNVI